MIKTASQTINPDVLFFEFVEQMTDSQNPVFVDDDTASKKLHFGGEVYVDRHKHWQTVLLMHFLPTNDV